jgi:predicted amidohydrolase
MSEQLRCTLVQTELFWEDVNANLQALTEKVLKQSGKTDLIILPEMFTTGFTMNPEPLADTMSGSTVAWMKVMAFETKATIMGSVIIKEKNNYYNRLLVVAPTGDLATYDKRHLFTLAGEHEPYTAGSDRIIVEVNGWKIMPMICYDLRFPVWSRMQHADEYDVLVYVANWPKPRIAAWDALLRARAIENQSYCIGVNRVGTDENGHEYVGHSCAYDFGGHAIGGLLQNQRIKTVTLDKSALNAFREKLPFLDDADDFFIK